MTDYRKLMVVHATLAEDAIWPWKRNRYATLSMMYAALANAESMDATRKIQADMAALAREQASGPTRLVLPEFRFWYDGDDKPMVMYGLEADDFLQSINEGLHPEVTRVEVRELTLWAQVYPANA